MTPRDRPRTVTLSRLDPGALLRDARAIAGMSQAELARRIGTTQPVVSRWEQGLDVPRLDRLARALQVCGFEVDLVFRRHDDVDRALIRGQLGMDPTERLASSEAVSELVGLAHAR
jgi:transcriptional regulator with XRE-family HTH domain